ncbi:AAA family ATPase [Mycobacterium sp. ITM-2016-00318]|uniref:AAA family ATPase n=1 Tax=Mycobacterium sp. ITM-2016-00318 TaxID=2099693 RepID=UPI001E59BC63|nr:AAA family ATPase [Mycobacterium sp. ITM-2016-00318]WNG94995.1 AAA family ATPase [Mycobacterium sp. ITM-2016-00318]
MTDDLRARGEALVNSGKYTNGEIELLNQVADEMLDLAGVQQESRAEESATVLTSMRDGVWLDGQEFPPLEYVVPDMIPEGLGVLAAPPKVGKSWFVSDVALASAAGGKALGRISVAKRPVLYLALEDGDRRLQGRWRRLMGGQPIPAVNYITRAETSTVVFAMICEFLQQHPGDKPLIILDTLGKVKPHRPAGTDPYQHDYAVGSQLKAAIDTVPGASLLVVHHTRKAESSDFIDSVSGTQGIAGSADFVMVLNRRRHSNDAVLSVTGRDISEAEYALHADDGVLWRLDGANLTEAAATVESRRDKQHLGDRALEVLSFVNSRAETALNETRAADLAEIGIDNDQARVYLNRLADSGRIKKIGRGLYQGGVTSVTSITNEDASQADVTHETVVTPLFRDGQNGDLATDQGGGE